MQSPSINTQAPALSSPMIMAGDRVVVVGAAASGRAVVKVLLRLGARVRLLDLRPVEAEYAAQLKNDGAEFQPGEHRPEHFADAALVVTSPGVPLARLEPVVHASAALRQGNTAPPIVGELELGLSLVQAPIIAVTGTSGKTTTASMVAAMLEAGGKRVFLGGNIGTPLCEFAANGGQADILVLECSSFQLSSSLSLHPRVGIFLNLAENHLDQHRSMQEYTDAKFSLFARQGPDDLAILHPDLVEEYRRRGFTGRLLSYGPTDRFPQSRLVGRHNAANAEAAWLAVREFGITGTEAAKAIAAFAPLENRIETLAVLSGVTCVNDTKCTTVEALAAALNCFDQPIILLAGGIFKGGDLPSLAPLLRQRVRHVALYGASREIFEAAWKGLVPLSYDTTMGEAFARALAMAAGGEVILLSPATSSFDQYKNYMERGNHFRQLVTEQLQRVEAVPSSEQGEQDGQGGQE